MNNPSGLKFAFGDAPIEAAKTNRKQPVQSRSRATCAAILEATIQVLATQGIERLTTTRVADRAGVSVGTLYQYYPNKAALTEAVRAEYFGLTSQAVLRSFAASEGAAVSERLAQAIDAVIEVKRSHSALSLALAKIPADEAGADFSSQVVRHFADALVPIVAGGAPPPETLLKELQGLVAAIEGALSFAVKSEPDWLNQPWFAEQLKTLMRAAIDQLGKT